MTEKDLKTIVLQCVEQALQQTQSKENETQYINKMQAASILAVSRSTVENLARAGSIKRHYIGKKAVRYERKEVLELAQNGVYYKYQRNTVKK
ncbi:MAG: helix-turn-helix domain-containing protein [Runella sp.]